MKFKKCLLLLSLVAFGAVGCSSETPEDPEPTEPTDPTDPTDPEPTEPTEPDEPEATEYTLTYQATEYDPEGFSVSFYTDYRFTQQVTSATENTTIYVSLGTYDYNLYSVKNLLVNGVTVGIDSVVGEYSFVVGTENVVVSVDWSLRGLFNQFLTDNFADPAAQNYSLYRTRYSRTVALDSETFEETDDVTITSLTPFTPYNSYVDGIVIKSEHINDPDDVQYVIYNENDGSSSKFYLNDAKTERVSQKLIDDGWWYLQQDLTYNCYYSLYPCRNSFDEQSTNVYKQTGFMYANYLYNLVGAGSWYNYNAPYYDDSKEYPTITFDHINEEIKIEVVTYSVIQELAGGYERYQEYYECTIKNIGTTEVDADGLIALMS